MQPKELTQIKPSPELSRIEEVLIQGKLDVLTSEERVKYYKEVCESVGLNPLTKPFEYIVLNSKLTLYANKSCTDQLRSINKISVRIKDRQEVNGLYIVIAEASDPSGRVDESIGALSVAGLKGDVLSNAIMKAETKAKRRATLSICGLGFLDDSEVDGAINSNFKNTQTNIAEVVRPKIENTKERSDIINKLEKAVKEGGLESLEKEWANSLTKEERYIVGAEELRRIKNLSVEAI